MASAYLCPDEGPPQKRLRRSDSVTSTSEVDIADEDFQQAKTENDLRLKSAFEAVFEKYSKDFTDTGDEVDLETGEIVVDNGHIFDMEDEGDLGSYDETVNSYPHPASYECISTIFSLPLEEQVESILLSLKSATSDRLIKPTDDTDNLLDATQNSRPASAASLRSKPIACRQEIAVKTNDSGGQLPTVRRCGESQYRCERIFCLKCVS